MLEFIWQSYDILKSTKSLLGSMTNVVTIYIVRVRPSYIHAMLLLGGWCARWWNVNQQRHRPKFVYLQNNCFHNRSNKSKKSILTSLHDQLKSTIHLKPVFVAKDLGETKNAIQWVNLTIFTHVTFLLGADFHSRWSLTCWCTWSCVFFLLLFILSLHFTKNRIRLEQYSSRFYLHGFI